MHLAIGRKTDITEEARSGVVKGNNTVSMSVRVLKMIGTFWRWNSSVLFIRAL